MNSHRSRFTLCILCALSLNTLVSGQLPIEDLPGYRRYQQLSRQMYSIGMEGHIHDIHWMEDGSAVYFQREGATWRFDLPGRELARADQPSSIEQAQRSGPSRRGIGRGRQRDVEPSPDGRWIARHVDWNIVIESADGEQSIVVTTEGRRKHRFGKASWVYGEELYQRDAMWWSPDSSKLAYYEFDERQVPDYHLVGGLTELRTEVLVEGYPKPGDPNPIATLWIYDLQTAAQIPVEVGVVGEAGTGDGENAAAEARGGEEQYVYNVRFSPDGSALLFSRTNRRQNVLEVMAADVQTGASRLVVREEQTAWQHNRPLMHFLEDGQRFIWETERSGWRQLELRHLDGTLINSLTSGEYPISSIVLAHEESGVLYYTAYSDENPLNEQLHRVNLDGSDQRRLTQESMNHSVTLSPCARWFITTYESAEALPTTALYDTEGTRLATLAEGRWEQFERMDLTPPELFSFKADDGETDLYGVLFKPARFDPNRVYPLIIDVYGGPLFRRVHNRWQAAEPACEFGFIIAVVDNRGTPDRGKAFEDAAYMRLGDVDLRDQAAAVRFLAQRPYIDGARVGIYGGSYGGYMAALAVLKHPDVFHVAVAQSAVTDWRNYDTIYTERFMRQPHENEEGYRNGSCLTFADNLRGRLLIMHGMLDDNVHPANAWQLIDALDAAKKPFEMRMFPRSGHGLGRRARSLTWEFFHRHLIGPSNENVGTRRNS